MAITRRSFMELLTFSAAAGAVSSPALATDVRKFSVLVATNEPYGSYHIASMVSYVKGHGGRIALVSPDLDHRMGDGVDVITVDQAAEWGADLLVVTGATPWPIAVIQHLDSLPVVASSMAYLNPMEAEGAMLVRSRLVGATAQSSAESAVFATHWGIPKHDITVVGNPQLDGLPAYRPEENTVLVATSVTHQSETGSCAPGTDLLMRTAEALHNHGYRVRVGLHPRENPSLWSNFEIAIEGTVRAAETAKVVVGIPGSVFPQIAALGAPLVGITDDRLHVPDYIMSVATPVKTVDQALTAVRAGRRPAAQHLRSVVGPLGGSRARLWNYWRHAVTSAEPTRPAQSSDASPEPSRTPAPPRSPHTPPAAPHRLPALPGTGR